MKKQQVSRIIIAIMIASFFTLSAAAAPAADTALRFDRDGRFTIMVIADVQDSVQLNHYTSLLMNAALDREKPDLVVLLGDNIYSLAPMLIFSEKNTKTAIQNMLEPITARGIPFCLVMGNHDSEGAMARKDQMLHYQTFPGCLAQMGDNEPSVGDYQLTIKANDSDKDLVNLWFLDSGDNRPQSEGGGYAYVRPEQIAWYEQTAARLKAQNDGVPLPSLLFQHIPVPELYQVLEAVPKGTPQAVRGFRTYSDRYFVANPKLVTKGTMGEAPCASDVNSGQFDSWLRQGDVMAAFFGHDHVNDFESAYQGIDLVYTSGVGFYAYGKGDEHGVRMIELSQSDPGRYATRMLYYKDLVTEPIPPRLSSMGQLIFMGVVAGGAAILLILGLAGFLWTRRRRRRRKKAQLAQAGHA